MEASMCDDSFLASLNEVIAQRDSVISYQKRHSALLSSNNNHPEQEPEQSTSAASADTASNCLAVFDSHDKQTIDSSRNNHGSMTV